MKISHQLFAILAFGALSADTAFAGHYIHHRRGPSAAAHGHGYGHDVNKSANTGSSTGSAPENAPGSGLKYQNVHNHHQKSPVGPHGGLQRNAVGAVGPVAPDAGLHRNAVGAPVEPNKTDHEAVIEHGNASNAAGPVIHDLDTKPVIENAPVNKLSPAAAGNKDHQSVTTALTLVRVNGQGIVGTGLNRRAIGMVALGGPQIKINTNTGVLSGNMFHPKHP